MPRGGYREKGAFKKGNFAALKHGKYSPRLVELLKEFPEGLWMIDKKTGLKLFKLKNKT
jgi:23S rRNA A2030 N6-methylase RlmJ